MHDYPLVFAGEKFYTFKEVASDKQVRHAQRLVRRIGSSKTLVCVAVFKKA